MKVPNALTRDDTVHGEYYYLASEVDITLAERDVEIERLIQELGDWPEAQEWALAKMKAQRRVLEQALEALKYAGAGSYARSAAAITAIKEQLK